MSIFKSKWVILKIDKLREKDFLYTIFTSDFWKIKANKKVSKTEKTLDLWYEINFEIHTKENVKVHKIRNIKILSEFNINKDKNFTELNNYLIILSIILREIPDWLPNNEILGILSHTNKYEKINETKLILSRLKIRAVLWELNINHSNKIIEKILKYVSNSRIENILKLTWINEEIKKELDLI